MPTPLLEVTREGELAIATLNRPPVNALDLPFLNHLADGFTALGGRTDIRAVVLTGGGAAFCAGMDLKQMPGYTAAQQDDTVRALNRMYHALYRLPHPVVAAVNGHAIAGGLLLALCADYRIVADGPFKFGLTEVRVGAPFPVSALEVARAEMRPDVARQVLLLGENVGPAQALAWGLFDEKAPPTVLPLRAREMAARMGGIPAATFARVKRQLRGQALERMEAVLAADNDPLMGGWLSGETAGAAAGVLHRKPQGRG